jgi:hypothetical protein
MELRTKKAGKRKKRTRLKPEFTEKQTRFKNHIHPKTKPTAGSQLAKKAPPYPLKDQSI